MSERTSNKYSETDGYCSFAKNTTTDIHTIAILVCLEDSTFVLQSI